MGLRRTWLVFLAGLIVLTTLSTSVWLMQGPLASKALPVLGEVPPLELVDQQNQPVTLETLGGRIWIASFIFTRCGGQCPAMVAQLAKLRQRLPADEKIPFVSFSVDPEWDTPERLAAYAASLQVDADQWLFVTGPQDAIHTLARHGFRLAIDDDPGSATEPITHSNRFVLVDQAGRIRGYYLGTDEPELERLDHDIETLLKVNR